MKDMDLGAVGMDRAASRAAGQPREILLRLLAGVSFLIFAQAFMVAPLIPRLASLFAVPARSIALSVPAYLIPYGAATLLYGPISDRLGRWPVMRASLTAFVLLTAATTAVSSAGMFIAARVATGLGASGVVPVALALVGDLFPYQQRGRALGWLFGAMAGGMAVGSTAGALLERSLGWRALFWGVAALAVLAGVPLLRRSTAERPAGPAPDARAAVGASLALLRAPRARRTYAYVLLNAIFHSGIFTWLGVYFVRGYGLGEVGIGLALLGYGVPGFLLGPSMGRLADRWGRGRMIPLGLSVAALSAVALAARPPLLVAATAVTTLSLGYDLVQPALAAIVTDLGRERGLGMGLNVFTLFTGFGLGSLALEALLGLHLATAFGLFGLGALVAALAGVRLFRSELPHS